MKNAIMGGEMIRPPIQTDEVQGLFCSWNQDMVPRLQVTQEGEVEISKLLPPDNTYLGLAATPLGYTEQVLGEPEFQLFDNYGICFSGTNRLTDPTWRPHTDWDFEPEGPLSMTSADRQIFEAGITPEGSGKILLSHENTTASGDGSWYLQPRRLQKRTGCSEVEAQDLADICKVLEATESMADTFCEGVRENGVDKVIEYLRRFVDLTDEDPKLNGLDNLNLSAIEGWEFSLTQAGPVMRVDGTMSDITMHPNPHFKWNWEPPVSESEGGAPSLDWHVARQYEFNGTKIQEVPDPQDLNPDWISLQPKVFQQLVTVIKETSDLEDLDGLTKYVQNANYLSVIQGRVLHSYIRAARKRLCPEKPSALAQGVIKRIQRCSKEKLGSLAKGIFNLIRDGKLKISRIDQRLIWKAYRNAKA